MLSRAQSAQQQCGYRDSTDKQSQQPLLEKLKAWFMPTPIAQFAALVLVFILGFNLNQAPINEKSDIAFNNLQQEVSSLSTVLAISMLQKSSASERLSGVAFSRQTDLSNPLLVKQLITLLARDKSTSVRLAIINSLSDLKSFGSAEQQLFSLAIQEENLLVQIELCRLLLNYGSSNIQNLLTEPTNQQKLKPEVREFIQSQLMASFI